MQKPFVFQPPATVTVVGSYAVGAATRSTPVADLAVEIPRTCLDDKDQLNHRYHAKRALYLAHIAAALRREAAQLGIQKVEWAVANGDPRRPSLLLHLAKGSSPAGTAIQILPTIAPGTFPLPRLAPTRNNLRSVCAPNPAADGTPQLLPTPHYNHSIVVDMLLLEHAHAFATAKAQLPHFAEAAVLLRVWARQQQLSTGGDGFTGFLLTMLLVHLVRQGHAVSCSWACMPEEHQPTTCLPEHVCCSLLCYLIMCSPGPACLAADPWNERHAPVQDRGRGAF